MLAFTIMKTLKTYIEREYTVEYEYTDDQGEINILRVFGPDGIEIKLGTDERDSITEEIEDDQNAVSEDEPEGE